MRTWLWEDLACLIKTLFFAMVLLWISAFLMQVLNSSDVSGQGVRETPRSTGVPTNTPPVTPTSTSPTRTPTATPTGAAPRMDVSCTADHGTWLCIVWVYPGYITGQEVIIVHNYGTLIATFEYLGDIAGIGWSVAVRWEKVPSCSIEFAEIKLMEMEIEPPFTTRIQQIQSEPFPPSPTHARYSVSWHCNLLPEIH